MSLIPEFELGLWNAWIFMGPFLLVTLLLMLLMMKKGGPSGSVRACVRLIPNRKFLVFVPPN